MPVQRTPLWPASWLPSLDKSRGSKSAEVQRVWEIYDDWLQFMARLDTLSLDTFLHAGDVSRAWLEWSSAAETAFADAYRFSGMRVVLSFVRRGRMPLMHISVGMFSCIVIHLLHPDLGRRIKAVMDVLDAMIRDGISLARSVEPHGSVG